MDTEMANEESKQVKGLMHDKQLSQAVMSRSLSSRSKFNSKRMRGDDNRRLLPCAIANTKRPRGEIAEGSSHSVGVPEMTSAVYTSCLTELPEILILEIILRLPVKSIFRCKSLSKRFCSLISSYYSSTVSATLMFQHEKYDRIRSRRFQVISDHPSLCEAHKQDNFDLSFLPFFPRRINEGDYEKKEFQRMLSFIKLEDTCQNLLLCSYVGNGEDLPSESSVIHHYICNVVSRQYVELPPAPAPERNPDKEDVVGFLCEEKGVGIPCSVSSGGNRSGLALSRYAVVRIASIGFDDKCSEFKIHVFCSETGCWSTSVVSASPRILTCFLRGSRLLPYKDKLHWLPGKCILVFDPFKDREKLSRIIDLPKVDVTVSWPHGFGVGGRHLRVAHLSLVENGSVDPSDPSLRIFELEDYDRGSWCLVFKISLIDVIGKYIPDVVNQENRHLNVNPLSFGVLAYHPEERDTVYVRERRRVIRCNMRTQMEEVMYRLQDLDPHFYFNQKWLYWETAFLLVHRWSRNAGAGIGCP